MHVDRASHSDSSISVLHNITIAFQCFQLLVQELLNALFAGRSNSHTFSIDLFTILLKVRLNVNVHELSFSLFIVHKCDLYSHKYIA